MAYKYSKGSTVQGDIKAADDTQRDTLIDFGEDVIDFQTSGSSVLKISGSNVYLAAGTNLYLSGGAGIYFDSDNTRDVLIRDSSTNNLFIDGNNKIRLRADENIIIQHNTSNKVDFDFNNNLMKVTIPMSSSQSITASALEIDQDINVLGAIYHQDFLMAELSIPGLDLQTDTNAYTFNCPYDLEVEGLQLYLDQHTTSGDVTVTVNGAGTDMITLSLTGTATATETSTVTSGSLNAADQVTFAITATPANAQGLRANLQFRRTPE